MSQILEAILKGADESKIKALIKSSDSAINLFEKQKSLKNKSLYEHLLKYTKLKKWTLEDLIQIKAVDLTSTNENNYNLLQLNIVKSNINVIKILLRCGVKLCKEDYELAEQKARRVLGFFNYSPGKKQPSIFEVCSSKNEYSDAEIAAILTDQANTSADESSEAEDLTEEELSESEQEAYNTFQTAELKKFNENENASDAIRLVAARGVHFSPTFFKTETREKIKKNKAKSSPTFSTSTLFDAGYDADSEVDENDTNIQKRHKHNLKFIDKLKKTKDQPEKTIKGKPAAKSRNGQKFENLYYRFMQVYINSYSRLFNDGSIETDFNFDSKYNPLVSAAWIFEKSGMYGSGHRMSWANRRDPHYRRFTGKAKHPNMGFIDIYSFDPKYVKENGFDRQLMCKDKYIKLNAFYRFEQEIIFISIIPCEFHIYRAIITLPSFNKAFNAKNVSAQYGIKNSDKYNSLRNEILELPGKKSSEYKEFVDKVTESAVKAQTSIVEQTVKLRLFKEKSPKVIAYDHGDEYKKTPFKF